jgi:predicted nucleic acid-binding protein
MSGASYLLDTNAFIAPYRRYYRLSFCPGFWDFLHHQFNSHESLSIAKVYDEIARNTDDLTVWLKTRLDKRMFVDTTQDHDVVSKYDDVSAWVFGNAQFHSSAKREFLQVDAADPWICAHAAVYGCTVVTEEVSRPQARKRVSLANVLDAFAVSYISVFDYIEVQQAKFILAHF